MVEFDGMEGRNISLWLLSLASGVSVDFIVFISVGGMGRECSSRAWIHDLGRLECRVTDLIDV